MRVFIKWMVIIVVILFLISLGKAYYFKDEPVEYNDFLFRNTANKIFISDFSKES